LVELRRDRAGIKRFLEVPFALYQHDPHWVAPILSDRAKVLGDENPFFAHARMTLWVAVRDGRDVGCIAVIIDDRHNERYREATAFFGFFDAVNDPVVSRLLFEAVRSYARQVGMQRILGPMNPSINEECGLLVEGFDSPPVLMMTYNPRSYAALIEGQGFRKAKDLLAYWFPLEEKPLERLSRVADRFRKRAPDITVRNVTKAGLARDLAKIREVYNEAWEKNWGFVPMTPEEMDFMAARLKPLLVAELLWIAEAKKPDGGLEPIAFMLMLPDYNVAIAPTRGRLLPFGWLKFLLAQRRIKTVRVVTLGVKLPWRKSGVQSIMMADSLRFLLGKGYTGAEVSWLLEDNELVIGAVRLWGGKLYKTYRIYEKPL